MRNSARKCIEISFKTEGVFAFFWSVFRIFFCWRRFFSEKRAFVLALSRWIFAGLSHYFHINPDLGLGPTVHFLSRFFQKAGDFFRKWHISFQNAALTDIKNEPKTHHGKNTHLFCSRNGSENQPKSGHFRCGNAPDFLSKSVHISIII